MTKKNREKLNERRRKRWREDSEFREKQAKRDRERRERLRKQKVKGNLDQYLERLVIALEGKGKTKPRMVQVKGKEVPMLTTGGLAEVVGRHVVRVQQWLADGLVPGCSAWLGHYRLFSGELARLICEALYETELQNARGDADLFKRLVSQKIVEHRVEVSDGKEEGRQEGKEKSR